MNGYRALIILTSGIKKERLRGKLSIFLCIYFACQLKWLQKTAVCNGCQLQYPNSKKAYFVTYSIEQTLPVITKHCQNSTREDCFLRAWFQRGLATSSHGLKLMTWSHLKKKSLTHPILPVLPELISLFRVCVCWGRVFSTRLGHLK